MTILTNQYTITHMPNWNELKGFYFYKKKKRDFILNELPHA